MKLQKPALPTSAITNDNNSGCSTRAPNQENTTASLRHHRPFVQRSPSVAAPLISKALAQPTKHLVDGRLLVFHGGVRALEGLRALTPSVRGEVRIDRSVRPAIDAVLDRVDLDALPQVALDGLGIK